LGFSDLTASFSVSFEACLLSGLRCGLVTVVAVGLAHPLSTWALAGAKRRWLVILLPMLMPSLLLAYAYGDAMLHLMHAPNLRLSLYDSLLAVRFSSLAAVIVGLSGTRATESAAWIAAQCGDRLSRPRRLWLKIQEYRRADALAFSVVWLLAFTEFEMASLFSVPSWSVALFDAHAGGIPLRASLWRALVPVLTALPIVGWLVCELRNAGQLPGKGRRIRAGRGGLVVLGVVAVSVLYPVWVAVAEIAKPGGLPPGSLQLLWRTLWLSALAALLALVLAVCLRRRGWLLVVCVPALVGALPTSLLMVALPRSGQTSVAALVVALTLLCFPIVAVAVVRHGQSNLEVIQMAPRLASRFLLTLRMEGTALFFGWWLATIWATQSITCWAMLAPIGLDGYYVRLHNLLHYGHNQSNALLLLVGVLVPLAGLLPFLWLGRRKR